MTSSLCDVKKFQSFWRFLEVGSLTAADTLLPNAIWLKQQVLKRKKQEFQPWPVLSFTEAMQLSRFVPDVAMRKGSQVASGFQSFYGNSKYTASMKLTALSRFVVLLLLPFG